MRRLWAVQLSPSRSRLLARRQQLRVLQWLLSVGAVHVFLHEPRLPDERRMLQRGVRGPWSLLVNFLASPAPSRASAARSPAIRLRTVVSDRNTSVTRRP